MQRFAAWCLVSISFSFVLRQDVAFFDANKTGLLVNRLTADIQEFKSSFKLVISQVRGGAILSVVVGWQNLNLQLCNATFPRLQGLRSVTQTVGCFVSLYIISPKLTGLTVIVLPCLVGAGALMGSVLRKLSRKAQEQVMQHCRLIQNL